MTIGKGVRVEFSTLTNVVTEDNKGADTTSISHSSLMNGSIGRRNSLAYCKAISPFHSEHDVVIEGDVASPVEFSDAWFGWGFQHRRVMNIGGYEISRDPAAFIEGVFPNEIATIEMDASGNPVFELDAAGQKIPLVDHLGNQIADDKQQPLYQCRFRVWNDIPATVMLGYNTIMASYDGKMNAPKSGRITGITGKRMPGTDDKESSIHYYYTFGFGGAIVPGTTINGVRVIGLPGHPDNLAGAYTASETIGEGTTKARTVVHRTGDVTSVAPTAIVGGPARNALDGKEAWGVTAGKRNGLSRNADAPAWQFTFLPDYLVALGEHLRETRAQVSKLEGRGMPASDTDGFFEAILGTAEATVDRGAEQYRAHRASGAWKYENGRFVNWHVPQGAGNDGVCTSAQFDAIASEAQKVSADLTTDSQFRGRAGLQRFFGNSVAEDIPHEEIIDDQRLTRLARVTAPSAGPAIGTGGSIGRGSSISPSAMIGNRVTIEEDVIIGPGVVIADGATIKKGSVLSFCEITAGATVGEDCVLTFLATSSDFEQRTDWDRDTKADNVTIGAGSELSHSSLICASVGRKTKGDRARIQNSQIGDENTFEPGAQICGAQYSDRNIEGGRVWGQKGKPDGMVGHHQQSSRRYTVVEPVNGGPNQVNFSAACRIRGTASEPVTVCGAFIGANCVVEKGSWVAGFAKNQVPAGTRIGYGDYWNGESLDPAGLLTHSFGFEFGTRHGLSKIMMVLTTPDARQRASTTPEWRLMQDIISYRDRLPKAESELKNQLDRIVNHLQIDADNQGRVNDQERRGVCQGALDSLLSKKLEFEKRPEMAVLWTGLYRNVLMVASASLRMRGQLWTEGELQVKPEQFAAIGKWPKTMMTAAANPANELWLEPKYLLAEYATGVMLVGCAKLDGPGGLYRTREALQEALLMANSLSRVGGHAATAPVETPARDLSLMAV